MEMDYFYEIFETMPRQGPGDTHHTLKALEIARPWLPPCPRVLDVGCGSGAQTLALAEALDCRITALDNHQPFLDRLSAEAQQRQLTERIEVCHADLMDIPFGDHEFDMIWSEGSIYLLGLSGGLKAWKRLLRPNGLMMCSDNLWLRRSEDAEVRAFWQEESPEMLDQAATQARIERRGYQVLGHFTLPIQVWEDSYYGPLEVRLNEMQATYPNHAGLATIMEALRYESGIFRRAQGAYSYAYWVLRTQP